MKKILQFFFIVFLLSLFAVSCMQAKEPEAKTGGLAADFKLEDLSQNTFSLSSYRDKQPVVLFFWTTWCPYCRTELKNLNEIYPQLRKDGWELLAINVGEPAYKVDNFVQGKGLTFKVLLDKDTAVADAYGLMGVPTYFFVDKKGNIILRENYFPLAKYKELNAKK
jgi:peroxiredoxin